jgi:hypothetical protein
LHKISDESSAAYVDTLSNSSSASDFPLRGVSAFAAVDSMSFSKENASGEASVPEATRSAISSPANEKRQANLLWYDPVSKVEGKLMGVYADIF